MMKKAMGLVAVLAMASWVYGQGYGNSSPQGQQPQSGAGGQSGAQGQGGAPAGGGQAGGAAARGTAEAPQGNRAPKPKTEAELKPDKAAASPTHPATPEK